MQTARYNSVNADTLHPFATVDFQVYCDEKTRFDSETHGSSGPHVIDFDVAGMRAEGANIIPP